MTTLRSAVLAGFALTVCVGCAAKKVALPPPAASTPVRIVPAAAPPAPVIEVQNTGIVAKPQPIPAGAVPVHELPALPALTSEREVAPIAKPPQTRSTPIPTSRSTAPDSASTPPVATPEPAVEEPLLPSRLESSRRDTVRSKADIRATLTQVATLIKQLNTRKLDAESLSALSRARSIVGLSNDALERGNLVQADDLAMRAASIARDLSRR